MPHGTRIRPDARLILLLGMLGTCGPIAVDMYLPSLPTIAADLNVSMAAVQRTLSAFMAGFSIGMLVYGPISDTYGRRPVMLGGVALYTVTSAACLFAGTIHELSMLRFLQALGAGAAAVLARAIARDAHEPGEAAKVISMVSMITSVGPLLAPLIGGQILRVTDWHGIFVVLSLFGAISTYTAWRFIPETWPRSKRAHSAIHQSFVAYTHMLVDPVAWGHLLCGGMAFAALFAYVSGTPFVYIEYYHVSPQHYGLLFGLNIVGIIGGNFLNTHLVGHYGRVRMIAAPALVHTVAAVWVCLCAITGLGGLPCLMIGLFFVVGTVGLLGANCATDLMHRYPHHAGAAAALFGAVQLALGAVSSLVVGLITHGTPTGMGLTIGGAGLLCFAGRQLVLRWQHRPVTGDR
jgi:MFS transporter, DHA1 family, multidrug resistance protein